MALSRVFDNKHSRADVLAGAGLGGAIGMLFALRALPRHRRLDDRQIRPPAPLLLFAVLPFLKKARVKAVGAADAIR